MRSKHVPVCALPFWCGNCCKHPCSIGLHPPTFRPTHPLPSRSAFGTALFHEPIVCSGSDGLVIVRDITFAALSEHTLLPFHGRCHIAYVPRHGVVLGLSKLARVTKCLAARLQTQEAFTERLIAAVAEEVRLARGRAGRVRVGKGRWLAGVPAGRRRKPQSVALAGLQAERCLCGQRSVCDALSAPTGVCRCKPKAWQQWCRLCTWVRAQHPQHSCPAAQPASSQTLPLAACKSL